MEAAETNGCPRRVYIYVIPNRCFGSGRKKNITVYKSTGGSSDVGKVPIRTELVQLETCNLGEPEDDSLVVFVVSDLTVAVRFRSFGKFLHEAKHVYIHLKGLRTRSEGQAIGRPIDHSKLLCLAQEVGKAEVTDESGPTCSCGLTS
jgi:hypothetical protein